MVVGKPDFELNSFGIQYKEKKVNYTNKKAGINVLSNNQTENEHAAESKISNIAAEAAKKDTKKKLTHSNQPTTRNATAAEVATGKKFENKDPQKPTGTTPSSITPKDGVFDNIPQSNDDMITQEGGSTHSGKEPKMPRNKLHGRAHQDAQATLRESKQNPTLNSNNPQDKTSHTPEPTNYETPKKIATAPKGKTPAKDILTPNKPDSRKTPVGGSTPDYVPIEHKGISNKKPDGTPIVKANEIILKMNIMKLDLMKKAPRRGSASWKKEQADSPEFQNAVVSETQRKARARSGKGGKWSGGMDDWTEHQDEENPMTREFYSGHDSGSEETRGKFENSIVDAPQTGLDILQAGKKVKKSASETIFKAISLKLDLVKALASNAGSTLVAAGTKKGKPNHINDKGVRTQDGQHTVRGKGVGTPEQVTIDGVKTTQPRTVAVKPKGNKKTSLEGDMQMSKEIENKTPTELKERMDYITNSPAYQESIHRDAPLTEKEGTEKFDNADPKTQAIRARIAARNAKKKSIDEINSMTDGMKELLKREGVKIGMGEKDTRQMTDRFNEEWGLPDTKEGKNAKRMLDDHVSPV